MWVCFQIVLIIVILRRAQRAWKENKCMSLVQQWAILSSSHRFFLSSSGLPKTQVSNYLHHTAETSSCFTCLILWFTGLHTPQTHSLFVLQLLMLLASIEGYLCLVLFLSFFPCPKSSYTGAKHVPSLRSRALMGAEERLLLQSCLHWWLWHSLPMILCLSVVSWALWRMVAVPSMSSSVWPGLCWGAP